MCLRSYRHIFRRIVSPLTTFSLNSRFKIVRSLNSPCFPPHIGVERRVQGNLNAHARTNQSKITRSQPRHSRQRVAQCLFQLALNLVPRSLADEAEGEIWPNAFAPRDHLSGMWQGRRGRMPNINFQNGGTVRVRRLTQGRRIYRLSNVAVF